MRVELSEKDLEEAIQSLDEEITERQSLQKLLAESRFSSLEEEEYHKMCETELRYTDTLGKALGERLGFSYKERTPNAFCYELANGWELRIPNSYVHGAEIIVQRYFGQDVEKEREIYNRRGSLYEVRENIGHIERGFFESGFVGKAMCVFGRKYNRSFLGKAAMVVEYTLTNPKKHYKERFKEIYGDLKVKEESLTEEIISHTAELRSKRKEQEFMLKLYSEQLLKWTDTVRVYAEGSSTVLETITR